MLAVPQGSFLAISRNILREYSNCCLIPGNWEGLTLQFSDQKQTSLNLTPCMRPDCKVRHLFLVLISVEVVSPDLALCV
jgi:hypothetical protein